jgi:penicillin amidase
LRGKAGFRLGASLVGALLIGASLVPVASCGDSSGTTPDCDTDPAAPGCGPCADAGPGCDPCEVDPDAPGCDPCAEDPDAAACDPCADNPAAPGCVDCTLDPLGDGCPTCEEEADRPWCGDCGTNPERFGCTFEEPAFEGLSAEVEIVRDGTGIAHIYGENDADVLYGSGYAQAVDRLFHMELARRRALGRRSELLGPAFVADDSLLRLVNIEGWARAAAERLRTERPDLFGLAVAWTAGVNARVDEVRSGEAPMPAGYPELGVMPERWSVVDAFALGKLLLFGNANQIEFDLLSTILRDAAPPVWNGLSLLEPVEDAFILPPEDRPMTTSRSVPPQAPSHPRLEDAARWPPGAERRLAEFSRRMAFLRPGASNNWALEGRHTDSGRPVIANDPHQPLRSPSIFWVHHMNSAAAGGSLDVMGFGFVGTPLVQLGHNRRVAWAATTNFGDAMDLWSVDVDGDVARVGDEGAVVLRHTETVQVRGEEPEEIEIERVPGYGVLLPEGFSPIPIAGPGRRLLLNWTGFQVTNEIEAFWAFDTAETRDDVAEAADGFVIGSFNWLAADRDGIVYRSGMAIPDRGGVTEARLPVTILDGDDPETFWTGEILPSELLPFSRATERGWIASANNDPYGFTSDGDVTNDPFYFGAFFDPGTRGARVNRELERLTSRGAVTLDEMKALQLDSYNVFADRYLPLVEQAWVATDGDDAFADVRERADVARLVTLLTEEWDQRMVRESPGALAFELFAFLATRGALDDDLGLLFTPIVQASPTYALKLGLFALTGVGDAPGPLVQEGTNRVVLDALASTADFLTERFGGVDPESHPYRWGDMHGTRFPSDSLGLFDAGFVPTDGGTGTVNVSDTQPFTSEEGIADRLASASGAIFRTVTSFREDGTPVAETNFPRGIAGEPGSALWDNTLDDWVEGRYRPLVFERAAVEAEAMGSTTLTP